MAVVSSAQSGPNLSNGSVGTRLGSASDWIRMKRLRAVRNLPIQQVTDAAKATTSKQPYGQALMIPREIGVSKIQRTASGWTDYKASQSADFVTMGRTGVNTTTLSLTLERICDCSTSTLNPRLTSCQKCSVKRWYTPRI